MMSNDIYDVIIMGAGIAGVCQARHLAINVKGIRILMVDNKPADRDDVEDYKIGESIVEIPGLFLSRELQLYEYILENHAPKFGLQFHWAKDPKKTDTLDDYHHLFTSQPGRFMSYHLHRSKFERDVIKKLREEHGVEYIWGSASVAQISEDGNPHTVKVSVHETKDTLFFRAKHLIDAAGRAGLIGNKIGNLIRDPKKYFNVHNNAAWVRVKNFDNKLFDFTHYQKMTSSNLYYTTNHMMGHGHWIWIIPLHGKEGRELSIGVSFQNSVIPWEKLNTQNKLISFYKNNHRICYNIIKSGEIVQFGRRPKLAFCSKRYISPNNWYIIGDAATVADPFYSPGLVVITYEVELNTSVIKDKLALDTKDTEDPSRKVDELKVKDKVESYNSLLSNFVLSTIHFESHHDKHLGHASIMSWRIYIEYTFGWLIGNPTYVGRYHLCPDHAKKMSRGIRENMDFMESIYCIFDKLVEIEGCNIGFMNPYEAGCLSINKKWSPTTSWDISGIINSRMYDPGAINLPYHVGWAYWYISLVYMQLMYRVHGTSFLYSMDILKNVGWCWGKSMKEYFKSWSHWWNQKPGNAMHYASIKDFENYKYVKGLEKWEFDSNEEVEDPNAYLLK